jgi:hypothetical protein
MSHSFRIDSKSALVGIAAALVCVVAMGQVSVSRATTPTAAIAPAKGLGYPHPSDMVHFTSATLPPGDLVVSIPVGGEHEVFTVPSDRWLVLLPTSANGSSKVAFQDQGGGGYAWLFEDLNGSYTPKANGGGSGSGGAGPSGWAVGWTFRPGSRVVLKNIGTGGASSVAYNFFGYLTGL